MAESVLICPECGAQRVKLPSGYYGCPNGHGKSVLIDSRIVHEAERAKRKAKREAWRKDFPVARRLGGSLWRIEGLLGVFVWRRHATCHTEIGSSEVGAVSENGNPGVFARDLETEARLRAVLGIEEPTGG